MIHARIRLGISACLLGEPVRFDGGHKRDPRMRGYARRRVEELADGGPNSRCLPITSVAAGCGIWLNRSICGRIRSS